MRASCLSSVAILVALLLVAVLAGGLQAAGKPTPPPANPAYVFEAGGPSGVTHLWVANADGTGRKDITAGSKKNHYYPVWSPDGSKIVHLYMNTSTDRVRFQDLYTVKPDGTGLTFLCHLEDHGFQSWSGMGGNHNRLDWSPDMRWIVYGGNDRGLWAVDISPNAQGSPKCEFLQLIPPYPGPEGNVYTNPAWSPVLSDDGTYLHTKIAYVRKWYFGTVPEVDLTFLDVLIDKVTGELTTGGTTDWPTVNEDERCPDWDYTGTRVAFDEGINWNGIWKANSDNSGRFQIDPTMTLGPRWSSDARLVVVGGPSNMFWRVCADGTGLTSLDSGHWPDWNPKWKNDLPAGTCP